MFESHSQQITAIAFSPNDHLLAVGSPNHSVRLWNPITGTSNGMLNGHEDWILRAVFSPNSRLLVTKSDKFRFRIWDVESKELIHSLTSTTNPRQTST